MIGIWPLIEGFVLTARIALPTYVGKSVALSGTNYSGWLVVSRRYCDMCRMASRGFWSFSHNSARL